MNIQKILKLPSLQSPFIQKYFKENHTYYNGFNNYLILEFNNYIIGNEEEFLNIIENILIHKDIAFSIENIKIRSKFNKDFKIPEPVDFENDLKRNCFFKDKYIEQIKSIAENDFYYYKGFLIISIKDFRELEQIFSKSFFRFFKKEKCDFDFDFKTTFFKELFPNHNNDAYFAFFKQFKTPYDISLLNKSEYVEYKTFGMIKKKAFSFIPSDLFDKTFLELRENLIISDNSTLKSINSFIVGKKQDKEIHNVLFEQGESNLTAIVGSTCSGKGVLMKELMFNTCSLGHNLYLIDNTNSHTNLIKKLNGTIISKESQVCLNPFTFLNFNNKNFEDIDYSILFDQYTKMLSSLSSDLKFLDDIIETQDQNIQMKKFFHAFIEVVEKYKNKTDLKDIIKNCIEKDIFVEEFNSIKAYWKENGEFFELLNGKNNVFQKKKQNIISLNYSLLDDNMKREFIQFMNTLFYTNIYLFEKYPSSNSSFSFFIEEYYYNNFCDISEFFQIRKIGGSLFVTLQSIKETRIEQFTNFILKRTCELDTIKFFTDIDIHLIPEQLIGIELDSFYFFKQKNKGILLKQFLNKHLIDI